MHKLLIHLEQSFERTSQEEGREMKCSATRLLELRSRSIFYKILRVGEFILEATERKGNRNQKLLLLLMELKLPFLLALSLSPMTISELPVVSWKPQEAWS